MPEDLFDTLLNLFTAAHSGFSQDVLFKMAGVIKRIEDEKKKYSKLDAVLALIHDREMKEKFVLTVLTPEVESKVVRLMLLNPQDYLFPKAVPTLQKAINDNHFTLAYHVLKLVRGVSRRHNLLVNLNVWFYDEVLRLLLLTKVTEKVEVDFFSLRHEF